ncbi:MAG TPA: hypothetical protein VN083_08070, partial [Vicinamibacteria bacterium]|nr:hypothetical protein [Vicinamibacteria bacterium]
VADGVEALEATLRLLPTVAILDRLLPRLRAEEVAERLGDNETTAKIPLIGLGNADDLGAFGDRFRAWIPKPVDRIILATTLGAIDGLGPVRAPRAGILVPPGGGPGLSI